MGHLCVNFLLTSMVLSEIIEEKIIETPPFEVDTSPGAVTLLATSLSKIRTPPSFEKSDPPIPF